MKAIKGVTFGYMSQRGEWTSAAAAESLALMQARTSCNTVILPVVVEQADPFSVEINWRDETVLTDAEVLAMARLAGGRGLNVILKPMVNLTDGHWRALINFFDHPAPCEPSWAQWFAAYTEFMLHYASLAEQMQAQMLVIGCELVNTDRREQEWRHLISQIRQIYHGLITYNCDKYQEDGVQWWDAVDVISSSGYYPINDWPAQLARIKKVVDYFDKPFFFCEAGCPSRHGSEYLPNDWTLAGEVDLTAQAEWYRSMFEQTAQQTWVRGFGLWDWKAQLYPLDQATSNDDYALYGKPAEQLIKNKYELFK